PWNGLGFSGFTIDMPNPILSSEFVVNQEEIYHKYDLEGSVFLRLVLTWDGKTLLMHWIERTQEWAVYADTAVDGCDRFGLCGPYGSCSINKHPPCHTFSPFDSNRRKRVFIIVLSLSSVVLLLTGIAYACRKAPYMKGLGNWGGKRHRSLKIEHLDDLQFFSLCRVARATNNFSVSNKIGEGGFGPVYK
nr:G-type lectin S-receptor-like serine/threonine-protein kinase At4g27290 [Tanacetum cinerariifolium]